MRFILGADAPAPAPMRNPLGDMGSLLMPLVFLFLIFWFMIIRPQKKKDLERKAMLEKLKKNDIVMTNGGMYGIVTQLPGNVIIIRVDDDTKTRVRVHRSFIARVISPEDHKKEEAEKEVSLGPSAQAGQPPAAKGEG